MKAAGLISEADVGRDTEGDVDASGGLEWGFVVGCEIKFCY